jgi:3-oxoacyl-[acyl-carrier protein] reductase
MECSMLKIKNCIVVGATQGVGLSLSKILTVNNVKVAAIGVNPSRVADLDQKLSNSSSQGFCLASDARLSSSVNSASQEIVDRIGKVDALVYCAGIGIFQAAQEMSDEDWNNTIAVNLSGLFHWTRAIIPHFSEQSFLVAISSGASKQGIENLSAYCASKYGLMGFMESMAKELSPKTKVSTVVPGSIMTNWGGPIEEKLEAMKEGQSKYLTPEDVAEAVHYILSQPKTAYTQEMNIWPA